MQKITIQHFGPIKQVSLEIKDFILLIGPQATGKSTIAKLIYFFKELHQNWGKMVLRVAQNQDDDDHSFKNRFEQALTNRFDNYFGYIDLENNFEIQYEYNPSTFLQLAGGTVFKWAFSENIQVLLEQITPKTAQTVQNHELKALETLFLEGEQRFMFVPAGRSALFSLTAQIQSLLAGSLLATEADSILDPITISFIQHWEIIKNRFQKIPKPALRLQKKWDVLTQLSRMILKGDYIFDGSRELLRTEGRKDILLKYASSGQQEAVRILEYLRGELLSHGKNRSTGAFVVIEEPEAHLYPTSQFEMVKAISLFRNLTPKTQVILTTHSPYILTALNIMLVAGETLAKYPDARIQMESIIPIECCLDVANVSAYYVNEGKIQSIVDRSNLIGANKLDDASDVIMDRFDAIMEVYKAHQSKKTA
jgi:energy-coupling factor transporter ATP-binding protein EcfA2